MDEPQFRVVFDGSLTGEFDEATAKRNFARLFRLDCDRLPYFFSGKERVIKSGVSEAVAMQYMIKVAEAGCECYIEEVVEGPPPGIAERRSGNDRRIRARRGPRPGAIVPDRRLQIRRAEDRRRFRNLRAKGQQLPVTLQSYPASAGKD